MDDAIALGRVLMFGGLVLVAFSVLFGLREIAISTSNLSTLFLLGLILALMGIVTVNAHAIEKIIEK